MIRDLLSAVRAANSSSGGVLGNINTSVIKRPIVEYPGGLLVGFKEAEWAAKLG